MLHRIVVPSNLTSSRTKNYK